MEQNVCFNAPGESCWNEIQMMLVAAFLLNENTNNWIISCEVRIICLFDKNTTNYKTSLAKN